jgi:hypothetical protein
MVFNSYVEKSVLVRQQHRTPLAYNLSLFAGYTRTSSSIVHAVLRIVNTNNASVASAVQLVTSPQAFGDDGRAEAKEAIGEECAMRVETLTSPLAANLTEYQLEKGGWNPPQNPTFISPVEQVGSM